MSTFFCTLVSFGTYSEEIGDAFFSIDQKEAFDFLVNSSFDSNGLLRVLDIPESVMNDTNAETYQTWVLPYMNRINIQQFRKEFENKSIAEAAHFFNNHHLQCETAFVGSVIQDGVPTILARIR
jgi:hypothetical protein